MASHRKTWDEKFHNGKEPKVVVLEKPYCGAPAGAKMVVASRQAVKDFIDTIPKGTSRTSAELRSALAKRFHAETACPTSTGIFVRIVSECALEALSKGEKLEKVTPFWRIVDPELPLASKLSCGPRWIAEHRRAEGIGP